MVDEPQKCGRCNRIVYFAEKKLAINKVWHTFCFSCAVCHKLLDSCTLNTYQGELYCSVCFQNVSSYDVSDVEDGPAKKRNIKSPKAKKTEPVGNQSSAFVCNTSNSKVDPISLEEEEEEEPPSKEEIMFKSKNKSGQKNVTIADTNQNKTNNRSFGLGFFSPKKPKPEPSTGRPEKPDKTLEKTNNDLYTTAQKSPPVDKHKNKSRNKKNTTANDSKDVYSTPMKLEVQEIDEMIQVPSRNVKKGCSDPAKCSKLCGPDKQYEKPMDTGGSEPSEKSLQLSKKDAKKNMRERKHNSSKNDSSGILESEEFYKGVPVTSTPKKDPKKSQKQQNSTKKDSLESVESNDFFRGNPVTSTPKKPSKKTRGHKKNSDEALHVDSNEFFGGRPATSTPKKKAQKSAVSSVASSKKDITPARSGVKEPGSASETAKKTKKSALGIKKKTSSSSTAVSYNGTKGKEKKKKNYKKNLSDSNITPRDSLTENYCVKIQERIEFMESLIHKEPPYDETDENICTNKTNFKHCTDMQQNCSCHTKCENTCECSSLFCKKLNEARKAQDGSSSPCQQDQCYVKTPREVSGYYSRRNITDPLCESCFPKCKRLSPDICRRCNNKVYIVEKMCAAGGVFHDCCFTCFICQRHLDSLKLVSRRGEIFCKQCYLKYFGPHIYGYNMAPNIH